MITLEVDGGVRKRGICAITLQDAIKVADTIQGMVAAGAMELINQRGGKNER